MYYIDEKFDLERLKRYGFKIGRDLPDNEYWICNAQERDDYWLVSMDLDEPNKINYADEDLPVWTIHINRYRRMWIDCVPASTYHIDNSDMEEMFYWLKVMIEDGVIYDDYIF